MVLFVTHIPQLSSFFACCQHYVEAVPNFLNMRGLASGEPAAASQDPEWAGAGGHNRWGAAGCAAHAAVWRPVWCLCRSCGLPHGSHQAPNASSGRFCQLCRSASNLLSRYIAYRVVSYYIVLYHIVLCLLCLLYCIMSIMLYYIQPVLLSQQLTQACLLLCLADMYLTAYDTTAYHRCAAGCLYQRHVCCLLLAPKPTKPTKLLATQLSGVCAHDNIEAVNAVTQGWDMLQGQQ